uniref:DUF834 domain-containing protein n=1 Tax=Oryza nivara TaxID=4536 RepID=A0A0E0HAS2_ORYNI
MGDGDYERRHRRPWAASRGGMADGCIWPARERWEECSEASSVRRGTVDGSEAGVMQGGVAGSGGSRLGARKRGQRWEADLVRGGVANGGRG